MNTELFCFIVSGSQCIVGINVSVLEVLVHFVVGRFIGKAEIGDSHLFHTLIVAIAM